MKIEFDNSFNRHLHMIDIFLEFDKKKKQKKGETQAWTIFLQRRRPVYCWLIVDFADVLFLTEIDAMGDKKEPSIQNKYEIEGFEDAVGEISLSQLVKNQ